MKLEYLIIKEETIKDLADRVNLFISKGNVTLVGGPFQYEKMNGHEFCQALTIDRTETSQKQVD